MNLQSLLIYGYIIHSIWLVKQSTEHVPVKFRLLHMVSIAFLLISFSDSILMLGWSIGHPVEALDRIFISIHGLPAWVRGFVEIANMLTGCYIYIMSYFLARCSSGGRVIMLRTIILPYLVCSCFFLHGLQTEWDGSIYMAALISIIIVSVPYILLFIFYSNGNTIKAIFTKKAEVN